MDTLVIFGLSFHGCPKYAGEREPVRNASLSTITTAQPPHPHSPTQKMKKSVTHSRLTYTQSQSERLPFSAPSLPRCFGSPCLFAKNTHPSSVHHSGHLWMRKKKSGPNSRPSFPLLFFFFTFFLCLSDHLCRSSVSAVRLSLLPPVSSSSLSQSPDIPSLSFPDVSISSVPVFHRGEATQSAFTSQAPLHSSSESGWSQGGFHKYEGIVRSSPLSSVLKSPFASPGHVSPHPLDPPDEGTSPANLYPSPPEGLWGSIAYAHKQKQHSATPHHSGERFSSSFSLVAGPSRGPFLSTPHAKADSLDEDLSTNEEAPPGAPLPFRMRDSSPPSFSFLGLQGGARPRALDTANDDRNARWSRAPGRFSFLSSSSSPDTSATTFNPLQFLRSLWGGGESSPASDSPSSLHPAAPDASRGAPEKRQQKADSQEENASVSEPSGAENKTVSPSPASEQDSSGAGPQSGNTREKGLTTPVHAQGGESQPSKPEGEESHAEGEGGSSEEKDSKAVEESKEETEREGEIGGQQAQEASPESGAVEQKLPENTSKAADAGSTTGEEPEKENESASSEEKPEESYADPSGKEDASNKDHEGGEGETNKEEEKSLSSQANSGTHSPDGADPGAGAAKTEEPKSENETKEEDEKAKTEKEPSASSPEETPSTDSVEEEKSSTESPEQQGGDGPAKNEETSPDSSNGELTTTKEKDGSSSEPSAEARDGTDTEGKTQEAENQEKTGGSGNDQKAGEEEEEKSVQDASAEETKQSETEGSPPSSETAGAQEGTAQTPDNQTPSQGESGEESHQDSSSATSTTPGDDSGDTTNKAEAEASSSSPSKEGATETPPPGGAGTDPEDSSGESKAEASSEAEASASEGDMGPSHGDQGQLGENLVQAENTTSTPQGSSEEKRDGEEAQVEEQKTGSEASSPSPSPAAGTSVGPAEETSGQKESSGSGEGGRNQEEEGSASGEEHQGVGDGEGVVAATPAVKSEEQLPSASVIFKFCRGGENEQGKSAGEGRETPCDPERDDSLGKIAVRVDNSLNLDLSRHDDWARVGRAMNAWLKHRYFSGREGKKMGWAHALHACVSGWMESHGTVSPKWIMMKEKMPEPTQRERQMFLDFYTEDKKTGHRTPSKVSCFRFLSHIHYFLLTAKKADQDVKGDGHASFPLIIKSSADMDFPAFVKERPELFANLVPAPPKERQKGEPISDDETARREGLPSLAFAFSMAQQHRSKNALTAN